MWSKCQLLTVRILLRGEDKNLNFWIPAAFYVLTGFLFSAEYILRLLPGKAGENIRQWADTVFAILCELEQTSPDTLVDVNVKKAQEQVHVKIGTHSMR